MDRRIGLACIAVCTAFQTTAVNAGGTPKLSCERGGGISRYGGTEWMVYGCSDNKTLLFITAQGNPATPFYFILAPKGGGYQLFGEGSGDKRLTDAAYTEIHALKPAQIASLLATHRADGP